MVAFIAGLLIVSSTIYFYTKIATQASHNSIASRDPEKTYFFYIVLLIVVASMSTIMSIMLIDSKAITAHTGTHIPTSLQLVAVVNIVLLFLPLLLLIVATVVVSAVLPLWSFIFSNRTRARDFTQVPMTNNSCDTIA
ncbi:unnamed protein product [Allacma fusca]|uniref:Uncharacterized protein n=1 Tax=Allacma fusca TaxID=39272 RepID=A0A8J2JKG1_9HEXA|nr:unnamed protein product [Allacma fusca]